jgi:hypothetical protein
VTSTRNTKAALYVFNEVRVNGKRDWQPKAFTRSLDDVVNFTKRVVLAVPDVDLLSYHQDRHPSFNRGPVDDCCHS